MRSSVTPGHHGRRVRIAMYLGLYCVSIFLVLDLVYSSFFFDVGRSTSVNIRSDVYDHDFIPNYAGLQRWGRHRYWLYTNSLGFKDATIREVPLQSPNRRVLVIGDSFTEAIGLSFEDSFVGMLNQAGRRNERKIEFLNAGVSGYSAAIYYRKIRYLIKKGLKFDEVLVAIDSGEIPREASMYFCIDVNPNYRQHCNKSYGAVQPVPVVTSMSFERRLKRHFHVTDSVRLLIKNKVLDWYEEWKSPMPVLSRVLENSVVTGWPVMGSRLDSKLQPLGVEGGIVRAQNNMQALAVLLASHGIDLTVSVHPWPIQLHQNDRNSRAVGIWRSYCVAHCKAFIDTFPAFFAYKQQHPNWYRRLFIYGDVHFNVEGNRIMFRELSKHYFKVSAQSGRAAKMDSRPEG